MKLKLRPHEKGVCPLCKQRGLIPFITDRTYFCPKCAKHFCEEFLMGRQPIEEWKQNQQDAEKMLKAWELNQEAHQKLQELISGLQGGLLQPTAPPMPPMPSPREQQEQADKDKYQFGFLLKPQMVPWEQHQKPKPKPPLAPPQLLIELRGGPMDGAKWVMPAVLTEPYKLAWPEGAEYRAEHNPLDNLWHYTYYGPEDLP